MNYSVNIKIKKIIQPAFLLFTTLFFVSCASKTESLTKIVGGKHLTLESSDTVKGVFPILTDNSGLCSATAVSHNTALTAAHCSNSNNSNIVNSRDNVTATQVIMHPQYSPNTNDYTSDYAVLIFPDNTFSEYFSIKASQAKVGDAVVLVGYSPAANNDPSKGNKRWGRNVIDGIERGTSAFESTSNIEHNSVGVTGGDSGGPLFVNCEIVGVTSRSTSTQVAQQGQVALHTDILVPQNASWLRDVISSSNAKVCGFDGDTSGCEMINSHNQYKDDRSGDHFPCSVDSSSNEGSSTEGDSTGLATAGEIKVAAQLVNNTQVNIAISTDIGENAASATLCLGTLESCTSDLQNRERTNQLVGLALLKNTNQKRIFSGTVTINTGGKTPITIFISDSNNALINHRYIQIGK